MEDDLFASTWLCITRRVNIRPFFFFPQDFLSGFHKFSCGSIVFFERTESSQEHPHIGSFEDSACSHTSLRLTVLEGSVAWSQKETGTGRLPCAPTLLMSVMAAE